ncbi:MAG: hypothetical protein J0I12_01205 [Candidatus Eremiobacteraeota bacterium]|nr:hypothetical protein [Candidatus Eremiobacteraeota bacterium]
MRRGTALLLFGINFLLTAPYWSTYFGMDDEAVTVLGATRLLRGEWPYYHWDTRHTPGSYLLSAVFFALLGSDRLATRLLMALVSALSGLLIYAIGRRTLPSRLAYLPWLLWCCGGLTAFPILSYHWWSTLFTLSTFYLVVRWREEPRFALPLGAALALAFWTLQSDGLASGLMIAFVWIRYRCSGLRSVLAAAVGTSLLLWAPFLPVLGRVWQQNFLDLLQHLSYNHHAYNWESWLGLGRLGFSAGVPLLARGAILSNFWLQTQTYGLYYITVVLSLAVFEKFRQPRLATLGWCMLAWAAANGNRQVVSYLAFSCPGIFLCEVGLLSLLPHKNRLALGWAACEIVGAGLRVGFLQSSWNLPIATRAGVYWTQSAGQAGAIDQAHQWSQRFFPPGSTVLSYPYFCSLYTTENLRNPLRVPVLTPYLYSRKELEDARQMLEQKQVEYIVYLGLDPQAMQESYGIPAEEYRQRAEEELQFITSGYRLLEGQGGLRLYQRVGGAR